MQQDDGGLGEARANYAARQEESRLRQQAIERELRDQARRVNLAAAAFIKAVQDDGITLKQQAHGYIVFSGSVWRGEDMGSWNWHVVVTPEGHAQMIFDGAPIEDVLSFRRYFGDQQRDELMKIRDAAKWLIDKMAEVLEDHKPAPPGGTTLNPKM